MNERLIKIKENIRKKEKWQGQLQQNQAALIDEQKKAQSYLEQLEKEEKDVHLLEGVSLQHLFFLILGKKEERLRKEKQEAIAAKLKYDEAMVVISELKEETTYLQQQLAQVDQAENEYLQLLQQKEQLLLVGKTSLSHELYELSEQTADLSTDLKELEEAIHAGKNLVSSLSQAEISLQKAKGWGTWDMLGGGMISTAIKHSHIDDAKNRVHEAQTRLRHFEKELKDVNQHLGINVNISGLLTFADYFFDGLIMDWVVQGRIADSLNQVRQKKGQIMSLVHQLEQQREKLAYSLQQLLQSQQSLIEQAK